ncbi:MAG: hypothetical protein HC880_11910, partial [Bacteroidia bacterium]|nr:hypothetical protein [Bacteroidia bacterium]
MFRIAPKINLDVRALYLLGGEAEYFDESQTQNWEIQFTGTNYNRNNIDREEIDVISPDGTPKRSETNI